MAPYRFGEKSQRVLASLHPDLQTLCNAALTCIDISLLEGYRSDTRQAQLLAEGKTKVGPGGSKHNTLPSLAIDMIPYPFTSADWKDRDRFHLFAGFVLGIAAMLFDAGLMSHTVRWGGDWNKNWLPSDNEFDDFPHFELVEV